MQKMLELEKHVLNFGEIAKFSKIGWITLLVQNMIIYLNFGVGINIL